MRLVSSLSLFLLFGGALASAATITIGAPGDANNGDCAPFGCAVEYQQVFGAGQFFGLGPISITSLTFFNNNFVPGDIAPATYSFFLSTTSAAVNGLDATFANNLGADNALFFSGALGGPIGATNQFTIAGAPFAYNPANGNLLMTITSDGTGQEFSVFLDFASGAAAGTFSRAYSFDTSGVAGFLESDTGLVTQFSYDTLNTEVPEPRSLAMVLTGVLLLCAFRRSSPKAATRNGLR